MPRGFFLQSVHLNNTQNEAKCAMKQNWKEIKYLHSKRWYFQSCVLSTVQDYVNENEDKDYV